MLTAVMGEAEKGYEDRWIVESGCEMICVAAAQMRELCATTSGWTVESQCSWMQKENISSPIILCQISFLKSVVPK